MMGPSAAISKSHLSKSEITERSRSDYEAITKRLRSDYEALLYPEWDIFAARASVVAR